MEAIRILAKSELQGTAYVEVLPGRYASKCWNESSLFFEEEIFGYFEPIISRHVPSYDHYSFTEIAASKWIAIVKDFRSLAASLGRSNTITELTKDVGFLFVGSETRFAEDFNDNKAALTSLLEEVSQWLSREAARHECITVLGL